MRKVILSVISTLAVIALIFVAGVLYMRGQGFSAREEPTWMERIMARNARKITTPPDVKNLSNPRSQTAEMIAEADEHFVEHCGICHGIDGRGDTVSVETFTRKFQT